MTELTTSDCLGQSLLIVGDVNTGKTTLCRQLLTELCRQGLGRRIGVLDLAPQIPHALALERGVVGAGGHLHPPPESGVLDLRAALAAPRLSSRTDEEAMRKAEDNARIIDALLAQWSDSQRDILVINDVTLYLQAGSSTRLLERIRSPHITTLVVNGYWGERLGGGALTQRETLEMTRLREAFESFGRVLTLTQRYL